VGVWRATVRVECTLADLLDLARAAERDRRDAAEARADTRCVQAQHRATRDKVRSICAGVTPDAGVLAFAIAGEVLSYLDLVDRPERS
jgi:hypothetical protein